MAEPARKNDELGEKGSRKPDVAPAILRLVKESNTQKEGPQSEDGYKSQTEDARRRTNFKAPPAAAEPVRPTRLEDRAHQAGRNMGQVLNEAKNLVNNGPPARQEQPGKSDVAEAANAPVGAAAAAQQAETPSLTGKGDPLQGAAQSVARDLSLPQKATWIIVGVLCGEAILLSILSLGLFIPGQIILLSALFISPKWTYKTILALISLIAGPEVYKYGQYIDPNDIKLTTIQRLIIVFEIVSLSLVMILEVFVVVNVVCRAVDTGPRALTFVVSRGASAISGTAFPTAIRDACVQFNDFISSGLNKLGGGTGNAYSGPISIGAWKDAINQSSEKYNIDACVMVAILQKESSGGDPNAIGHDNHSGRQDPFQTNNPPRHGLDWSYSHGIGITQITIFPYTHSLGHWPDPNVPSRTLYGTAYIVSALLNPLTSIDLTAHIMADNIKSSGGNVREAFRKYNGSGPRAERYADEAKALYDQCKIQGF